MPVKYFAPKVTMKLCIIDFFPPRDDRGQNNEETECLLRPQILAVGTTANSPLNKIVFFCYEIIPTLVNLISTVTFNLFLLKICSLFFNGH